MDEAGWQSCSDLDAMIAVLNGKISVRKARLFEAACCRRICDLISEQRCQLLMEEGKRNGGLQLIEDAGGTLRSCREAVELAERAADGNVSEADLVRASVAAASYWVPSRVLCGVLRRKLGPIQPSTDGLRGSGNGGIDSEPKNSHTALGSELCRLRGGEDKGSKSQIRV